MIPNCKGCDEERAEAERYVREGYHIATTKEKEFVSKGKHYSILIVDDDGKIICS